MSQKEKTSNELGLRLASAAILIPFGLFVVYKGGVALAVGCAIFAALMTYEWVRMSASPAMKWLVLFSIVPVLVAPFAGLLIAFLVLLALGTTSGYVHPLESERRMSTLGYLYAAGMPLALYALREGPWDGQTAALIIMGIVWGSDSAAYFAGRGFGGPPLTPDSPSKTWTGALGAVIFSSLSGVLAAAITGAAVLPWLISGAIISILAQSGDLIESMIKRHYGVKDSSGLVPGHGGILDRVDGLGIVCVGMVVGFLLAPDYVIALGLGASS